VYPISEQQQSRTKVGGVVDRGQTSRADPEEIREFSRQFPLPGVSEDVSLQPSASTDQISEETLSVVRAL
jgi:hypothetical protein